MPAKAEKKTAKRPSLTPEHKTALVMGREQGAIVRQYLNELEANKPRRGRKRTPESIKKRLAAIEEKLPTADPLERVHLIQERKNLQRELREIQARASTDMAALEDKFVTVAKDYSERKGISYATWREAGVPAAVLKRAGIRRTERGD
ncbi:MAG: hypothetical protein C4344_03620 [Acidimicrobiia bacterium]